MAQSKNFIFGKLRVDEIQIGPETGAHMTLDPSALWLWRDTMSPCTALRLDHGHPHLSLYDANGHERVSLFVEKDGTPTLLLKDGNSRTRLEHYIDEDGSVQIRIMNGAGKTALPLYTDEDDNAPVIALCDSTGEEILEIMLNYEGKPALMVRNQEDHRVPWLTAKAKEEA